MSPYSILQLLHHLVFLIRLPARASLFLLPLFQPGLDKLNLRLVCFRNLRRRQTWDVGILRQAKLIPVMHAPVNHHKRLIGG